MLNTISSDQFLEKVSANESIVRIMTSILKSRQYKDMYHWTESLRQNLQLKTWSSRFVRPDYNNKDETWMERRQRTAYKKCAEQLRK